MSRFAKVEQGPPIEVFALNQQFQADTFPNKVSLGVGGEFESFWGVAPSVVFFKPIVPMRVSLGCCRWFERLKKL
jgi:hypothetical protein